MKLLGRMQFVRRIHKTSSTAKIRHRESVCRVQGKLSLPNEVFILGRMQFVRRIHKTSSTAKIRHRESVCRVQGTLSLPNEVFILNYYFSCTYTVVLVKFCQ